MVASVFLTKLLVMLVFLYELTIYIFVNLKLKEYHNVKTHVH